VKNPASAFDVAEVADGTPYHELLAYEGLGLCKRDKWNQFVESGTTARGRQAAGQPVGRRALVQSRCSAAGLVRIAEAANQVRGRAGPASKGQREARGGARRERTRMHYNTVVVMEGK
jgi:acetyl-CoA C-acetyltransferase